MSHRARRSCLLGTAVIGALLLAALLAPASAIAVPGDSESNAVTLTVGALTSGALTTAPASSADYLFVYSLQLTAGQTIVATYTPSPAVTNPDMLAWASFGTDIDWLRSAWIAPGIRVTHLLAPRTGKYFLSVFGRSAPGTFTVESAITAPVDYSLGPLAAPSTAHRNKSFAVGVRLLGQFDELNTPIRFVVMRKSGRIYTAYRTLKPATSYSVSSQSVPFSTSVKLPAGTFLIRARFLDAAHPVPLYNAWKRVVVN